jgi:hypothetical protein
MRRSRSRAVRVLAGDPHVGVTGAPLVLNR